MLLKRDMSIDYLCVAFVNTPFGPLLTIASLRIPDAVIDYIYEFNLYRDLDMSNDSKGKDKADSSMSVAGSSKG